jgi:uncharacterized protein (DUF362 family)
MSERPAVVVVATKDHADLQGATAAALDATGLGELLRPGAKVLVKPNFHGGEGYTSPAFIEALVREAQARGAGEVVVGDGPFYGLDDASEYYERIGAAEVCRELGARLVTFHQGEYDVVHPGLRALPETIGVTRWVSWADVVINAPVMKTHFNTATTLAIKCLKGCIRPRDKRDLHMMDLHLAIAGLAKIIRPHITIMDATVAYEGMGPCAGTPVDFGLVIAGATTFDVDVVANWLMGFEPDKVRYLREAETLGLGQMPAGDEAVAARTNLGAKEMRTLRREFARPYDRVRDEFPNLRLNVEMACSGCLMNLFTALSEMKAAGETEGLRGYIAIGRVPEGEWPDLAVGACTFSAWEESESVPGCPPAIEEIKGALRKAKGKG